MLTSDLGRDIVLWLETLGLFFHPKIILVGYLINGGNTMRTRITLACTECKNRNYDTTKDKKTHPDRIEIRKYCKFCKKHTTHKETK